MIVEYSVIMKARKHLFNAKLYKKLFYEATKYSSFDDASALAFYFLLSLFPLILIVIHISSAIYFDTSRVEMASELYSKIPHSFKNIFVYVVTEVKAKSGKGVSFLTYLFAIWTIMYAADTIIRKTSHSFINKENQNYIHLKFKSFVVSIVFIFLIFGSTFINFIGTRVVYFLKDLSLISYAEFIALAVVKFVFTTFAPLLFFTTIYYINKLKGVSFVCYLPGILLGSLTFVIFTQIYSYYLLNISSDSATYGSVGAVIGLISWLYITGYIIIIGSLLNDILIDSPK